MPAGCRNIASSRDLFFGFSFSSREGRYGSLAEGCQWMPEYGSWMLEGTPKYPLEGLMSGIARLERNMSLRRKRLTEALADDEIAPTVRVRH